MENDPCECPSEGVYNFTGTTLETELRLGYYIIIVTNDVQ